MSAGITINFRGQCLSSVTGQKVAYNKFIAEAEIGQAAVEFQVSCPDGIEKESLWKLADWEIKGFEPVSGTSKEGRQYAYFRCQKITGKLVK